MGGIRLIIRGIRLQKGGIRLITAVEKGVFYFYKPPHGKDA
jgi:hypothetical protein